MVQVKKPRRIVFYSPRKQEREMDELAVTLAGLGKSHGYIRAMTGLSKYGLIYALKRGGVRLSDARNGIKGTLGGRFSEIVMKATKDVLHAETVQYIHANVAPPMIGGKAHTSAKGDNPYPLEES